jgi:hypothetical protein
MYPCPLPGVSVSMPGYRRVNRYTGTGLRRVGHHFFWKKSVVLVPVYRPPPVYYSDFTKTAKKNLISRARVPVPEYSYPYLCPSTRIRICARVPETGTGMKRVGYGFEKKTVYPYLPCPCLLRLCPVHTR